MTTTTETPTTEQVIAAMLTENTGRHMLDSGGAYGRAWERNQGRAVEDFEAEPEGTIDQWGGVTLSVFHFLKSRLSFEPDMQALFDEYCELPGNEDEGWLTLMEGFLDAVAKRYEEVVRKHGCAPTVKPATLTS